MPAQKLGRRPRKTRTEVYNAAIALFRERGVHAVTMQDIADKAETARSTVFNHYSNKNAFVEEFFKRFGEDIIANTKAKGLSGFRKNMHALYEAVGDGARQFPMLLKDIASMALSGGPLAKTDAEIDTKMIDFLTALVEEGIETGEVRADHNPLEVAELLLAVLAVTNHDWVNKGQRTNLADDQKKRFDIVVRGLAP